MAATTCPTPIRTGRCQGTCQRPFFEGQVDGGEPTGRRHHELEVRPPPGADRGQLVFGLPDGEGRIFHVHVNLGRERHRLSTLRTAPRGELAGWHPTVSGK